MFFPETVFFKEDGKIEFMTTMKDCSISIEKKYNEGAQSVQKIRGALNTAVAERRWDQELFGCAKKLNQLQ